MNDKEPKSSKALPTAILTKPLMRSFRYFQIRNCVVKLIFDVRLTGRMSSIGRGIQLSKKYSAPTLNIIVGSTDSVDSV